MNSTLRDNNSQSLCYWSYWSVFDDHGGGIGWCGAPCPMRRAQDFPWCHWTPLPGECLRLIPRAAAMVIDVACGPMAYKTQVLAYHLHNTNCWFLRWNEKEWLGWYRQRMSNIQCKDLMMLRFSNTKSIMLFKILSVDKALWVELDKLLDKRCESRSKCGYSLVLGPHRINGSPFFYLEEPLGDPAQQGLISLSLSLLSVHTQSLGLVTLGNSLEIQLNSWEWEKKKLRDAVDSSSPSASIVSVTKPLATAGTTSACLCVLQFYREQKQSLCTAKR